jgi:hypothetical protein
VLGVFGSVFSGEFDGGAVYGEQRSLPTRDDGFRTLHIFVIINHIFPLQWRN